MFSGLPQDISVAVSRALAEAVGPGDLTAAMEAVRQAAEMGVGYISVGSLTERVQAVDLSMRFEFGKH